LFVQSLSGKISTTIKSNQNKSKQLSPDKTQ